jgi:hypothetical protein
MGTDPVAPARRHFARELADDSLLLLAVDRATRSLRPSESAVTRARASGEVDVESSVDDPLEIAFAGVV